MAATPSLNFKPAKPQLDMSTIIGLCMAILLIIITLVLGGQYRIFYDTPSLIIVFGGTFAISLTATTWTDFANTMRVLKSTFSTLNLEQSAYGKQLLTLAVLARQQGLIQLQTFEKFLANDSFLLRAIRLVIDGMKPEEIESLLKQEIDTVLQRQEQAVRVLRRGAEIAPAMGLIGTLVGLVQMLAKLEDPSSIGPSMALALLTTFYGAVLGTVVLTPLATKLEKRTHEEVTLKVLVLSTAISIARQENPRHLEIQLNTLLAPKNRIRYFEE